MLLYISTNFVILDLLFLKADFLDKIGKTGNDDSIIKDKRR